MVISLFKHCYQLISLLFCAGLGSLDITRLEKTKQFIPLFLGWQGGLRYGKKGSIEPTPKIVERKIWGG